MDPIGGISSIAAGGGNTTKAIQGVDSLRMDDSGSLERAGESGESSFSNMLSHSIDQLVSAHQTADKASLDLAAGKRDDVFAVMLDVQKAGLSMQLALEARNRVVDAYHEVMRMTV